MDIKKFAFLLLSFSVAAFAGKVITYTASSEVSQEQANNTAIAGVAKQISSNVVVDDRLNTTDVASAGKETISQSYTSKKKVTSDVNVKWISVRSLPKEGKRFRATATLDVDEMTGNLRLQMSDIRKRVAKFEADARKALDDSRYDETVRNYGEAISLLRPYAELKAELAEVFTLDESFNLKHDLGGLKSLIVSKLGNIRFDSSPADIVVESDFVKDFAVTVRDARGPVADFPLKAVQDGKRLDMRRTRGDGTAVFTLQGANTSPGTQTVSFVPDFPTDILREAGLEKGFSAVYDVKRTACNVRLDCKGNADACMAFESELAKSAIYVGKDTRYPQLKAEIVSTPKASLGKLVSFDMSVSVSGDRVKFSKPTKGVGKSEAEAMGNGIAKLKLKDLREQVARVCAE